MKLTEKEKQARERVCLALDVPTLEKGLGLTKELSDYVGSVKINSLYNSAANQGKNAVEEMNKRGAGTFLDLKYHDTPNTVFNYAKDSAVPGTYMFNVHVAGGEEMCKKAIEGSYKGSEEKGIERPSVIGITVLTSLDDKDLKEQGLDIKYDDLVKRRTELAKKWGLDGVVCPAKKAGNLEKEFGSDFLYVTPGVKWAGVQNTGQKQLYTPDKAVKDCSNSILVVGSAITKAGNTYEEFNGKKKLVKEGSSEDRQKAAYGIIQSMAENM